MKYLLDTNAWIHFLNASHPSLVARVLAEGPASLAVSTLSLAELEYGAARSGRPKANLARIETLRAELRVEPFDDACARMFGKVKADLMKRGRPMSDFDIGIAATALVLGLTVVSDDADLEHVKALSLENWSR